VAGAARRIEAGPVGAGAWAPFGWIPRSDGDPADGQGEERLGFDWADPHLNVISHGPGEVERVGEALRCDRLFRHDSHTQALLVLNCEAVVAVAPATVAFDDPVDVDSIRAFHLRPMDRFVLHRGTWHWGPHPLGVEPVLLYNLQGRRYAEDNASVDLAALGAALDVVVPGR
jgi:hypothetical protein